MKKKPIDLPIDASGAEGQQRRHPLLIEAISVIILAMAAIAIFTASRPPSSEPEGRIDITLGASQPYLEGGIASVQAFSSCGDFTLSLDGVQISSGPSASAAVPLIAGQHTLEASNSRCSDKLAFTVIAKECVGNQTRGCSVGACTGTQECSGGFYGECMVPPKICTPGVEIGCSIDGCHFGYAACNECGNGFGPCLPRDSGAGGCSSAHGCN